MKKNMGTADRVIRILAALVMVILYIQGIVDGTAGIIMLVAAGIFVLTGFVGTCPLYLPLNISTRKKKS